MSSMWCLNILLFVALKCINLYLLCFIKSTEMLQSEGSFSMGGRHSSIDSNRASSGDISPYDNNSPVLSERSLLTMQEDTALSSDKLFRVPEQRLLVSNLPPKPRENFPGSWLGKGMFRTCLEQSCVGCPAKLSTHKQ